MATPQMIELMTGDVVRDATAEEYAEYCHRRYLCECSRQHVDEAALDVDGRKCRVHLHVPMPHGAPTVPDAHPDRPVAGEWDGDGWGWPCSGWGD